MADRQLVAFKMAGTPIDIEIRGTSTPPLVMPKPIYRKPAAR